MVMHSLSLYPASGPTILWGSVTRRTIALGCWGSLLLKHTLREAKARGLLPVRSQPESHRHSVSKNKNNQNPQTPETGPVSWRIGHRPWLPSLMTSALSLAPHGERRERLSFDPHTCAKVRAPTIPPHR